MKKKQLISYLDELETFKAPKIQLEQYATGSELCAEILLTIDEDIGFEDRLIGDLGCGAGILMIGAALMGGSMAMGFDVDMDALRICRSNIESMELESSCNILQMDVLQMRNHTHFDKQFSILLSNPPFGCQNNNGIDLQFVQSGLSLLEDGGSLFSLHKTSTRDFLMRKARQWNNVRAECVAELRWNLDRTYKHQKKHSVDIEVDLLQFRKV